MNINDWNKEYNKYIDYLISLKDDKNKDFSKKLINTKYDILGIKLPILRNIAKEIINTNYTDYLKYNNFKYFEEVMIRGFVIAFSKSEEILDIYLYDHIKYIDNWSLCDSFCNSLKIVKDKDKYFNVFKELTKSDKEYFVRVGLISILGHFINDKYIDDILNILDNIKLDTYYVNMANGWLLCECFIKQRDKTLKYLNNSKLNKQSFNKGIQKCIESYRVSKEDKDYLRTIKKINSVDKNKKDMIISNCTYISTKSGVSQPYK